MTADFSMLLLIYMWYASYYSPYEVTVEVEVAVVRT